MFQAVAGGGRPSRLAFFKAKTLQGLLTLEQFQFETLRVSNHTACRFAEKTRFFRSLWAGRRCPAASRFNFFKGETL